MCVIALYLYRASNCFHSYSSDPAAPEVSGGFSGNAKQRRKQRRHLVRSYIHECKKRGWGLVIRGRGFT